MKDIGKYQLPVKQKPIHYFYLPGLRLIRRLQQE